MELISPLSSEALDIEAIKAKIKTDLITNNVITDIDYEGSNISILTQILAYLTQAINSTHAMNANQTNLKLSEIRQNIIHEAQTRGYNITRKVSSKMNITLSINPLSPNLTIPAWSKFKCGEYTFYNTSTLEFSPSVLSHTIDIVEGVYIDYTKDSTLRFTSTEQLQTVVINYKNVENNNVYFRKKKSSDILFSDTYTKVSSLLSVVDGKINYFEEYDPETEFIKLWVYFAGQGNIIDIDDVVDVSFLISSGTAANGIIDCALENPDSSITITVNSQSRSGTNEETNDSIKANAPLFYNTGGRTVSEADYSAYLVKSSLVEKISVWGGEVMIPKKLGHVFLSVVPQDVNFKYLTALEEVDLIRYMNEKPMIATGRIFKHPNYISFDFEVQLIGNVLNTDDSKAAITQYLTEYFTSYHNNFNTYIFENKIIRLLEATFDKSLDASLKVFIYLKLRLSKELFKQSFDNGRCDIWIPNSAKKYFLTKASDKIPMPENEADLYTYLLNGWVKEILPEEDLDISFSGTINGKILAYPATITTVTIDGVVYNKRNLTLDGLTIGYYVADLNLLSLEDLTDDLPTDGFINITYSPEINIKSEKSTLMELGSISFI